MMVAALAVDAQHKSFVCLYRDSEKFVTTVNLGATVYFRVLLKECQQSENFTEKSFQFIASLLKESSSH
ncbi:hypothetical protein RB195_014687 [Necator americanus]|uniref:Uncharacterized protein n=1 Tax=Necator americanus TaxID=51031 RepID=A0ABR1E173_NECAM